MFFSSRRNGFIAYFTVVALVYQTCFTLAEHTDWPVFGRDATRNAVVPRGNASIDWDVASGRNIKWKAQIGYSTFASTIVAGGQVYIGTNNGAAYLERYPMSVDLGCLLCFRESDGQFLWQYSAEKHPLGRVHDWPDHGLVSSPLVEGDRLWFVSNRHVLLCVDAKGFRDGENDGPFVDEPFQNPREADVIWQFDLIKELGVFPHPPGMGPHTRCSIAASYGNRIYVVTGNGTDEGFVRIPAPDAPSLVCFDKNTGKVLWTDASPGANILDCQASHPLVVEIDGRYQVIVGQGDGWLRSFDAETGELLWKFDINYKESVWSINRSTRNHFLGTPVLYKRRVYIASGVQPEQGGGKSGRLVCIDPTKSRDISSELAVDVHGNAIPHRRIQAVNSKKGERAIPNPNSGLIWEFTKIEESKAFEDQMHGSISTVAIHDGLVIAPDFQGMVHCLNAETGKRYWSYDPFACIWASPLIVDKYVYVPDEDGDVAVFRLSSDPNVAMKKSANVHVPIAELNMGEYVYSSPVFANDVLYGTTRNQLYAIAAPKVPDDQAQGSTKQSSESIAPTQSNDASGRVAKSVYSPTPQDVVETMLNIVHLTKDDTLVDLGSGDGRILITAAERYGAKAIGYEIDRELVARSRSAAERSRAKHLIEIREQDMYTADLAEADVVTLYLYPASLDKLKPQFAKMHKGSKIVSHHYEIPDVTPDRVVISNSHVTGDEHCIFLYSIPLSIGTETSQ